MFCVSRKNIESKLIWIEKIPFPMYTLFFLIRTSNFAAEAEPKQNVLILFTF